MPKGKPTKADNSGQKFRRKEKTDLNKIEKWSNPRQGRIRRKLAVLGPKQGLQRNFGKVESQKKSKSQINDKTCVNESPTETLINVTCHIQRKV